MISTIGGIFNLNHFDQGSRANDVIVIRGRNGELHSSPFNVRFGRAKLWNSMNKVVQVEVNGELTSAVMKIGKGGEAYWLQPTYGHFQHSHQSSKLSPRHSRTPAPSRGTRTGPGAGEPSAHPLDVSEGTKPMASASPSTTGASSSASAALSLPAGRESAGDRRRAHVPDAEKVLDGAAGQAAVVVGDADAMGSDSSVLSDAGMTAQESTPLLQERTDGTIGVLRSAIHTAGDAEQARLALQAVAAAELSRRRLSRFVVDDPFLMETARQDGQASVILRDAAAVSPTPDAGATLESGHAARRSGGGDSAEPVECAAASSEVLVQDPHVLAEPLMTGADGDDQPPSHDRGRHGSAKRRVPHAASPVGGRRSGGSSSSSSSGDMLYGDDDTYFLDPVDVDDFVAGENLSAEAMDAVLNNCSFASSVTSGFSNTDIASPFLADHKTEGAPVARSAAEHAGATASVSPGAAPQSVSAEGTPQKQRERPASCDPAPSRTAGGEHTPHGQTAAPAHTVQETADAGSLKRVSTSGEELFAGYEDLATPLPEDSDVELEVLAEAADTARSKASRPPVAEAEPSPSTYFVRTLIPVEEDLRKLHLISGCNSVRYLARKSQGEVVAVSCNIFLWDYRDRLVVSDVDGTITKSDLWGHFYQALGKGGDWTHPGICSLFSKIAGNGYKMIYLTARSMAQIEPTKRYLWSLEQDGQRMPLGPVLTAPQRFFTALTQEVSKQSHVFKIACLTGVKAAFPPHARPFFAGFGNRYNDLISYDAVGIPIHKIFIIDPSSVLHVCQVQQTYRNLAHLVDVTFPRIHQRRYHRRHNSVSRSAGSAGATAEAASASDAASRPPRSTAGSATAGSSSTSVISSDADASEADDGDVDPACADVPKSTAVVFSLASSATRPRSAGGDGDRASERGSKASTTDATGTGPQQQQQSLAGTTTKGCPVPPLTAPMLRTASQVLHSDPDMVYSPHLLPPDEDVLPDPEFSSYNYWRLDPKDIIAGAATAAPRPRSPALTATATHPGSAAAAPPMTKFTRPGSSASPTNTPSSSLAKSSVPGGSADDRAELSACPSTGSATAPDRAQRKGLFAAFRGSGAGAPAVSAAKPSTAAADEVLVSTAVSGSAGCPCPPTGRDASEAGHGTTAATTVSRERDGSSSASVPAASALDPSAAAAAIATAAAAGADSGPTASPSTGSPVGNASSASKGSPAAAAPTMKRSFFSFAFARGASAVPSESAGSPKVGTKGPFSHPDYDTYAVMSLAHADAAEEKASPSQPKPPA